MSMPARSRIEVRGIVQGVGFRPFVYRLAHELRLAGWVNNDGAGVTIEVAGRRGARRAPCPAPHRRMRRRARASTPSSCQPCAPREDSGFAILESGGGPRATRPSARTAPSATTVSPSCSILPTGATATRSSTARICGPRYTITRALPYDRAMTVMAAFAQCPACLAEYRAPVHRRFHAEPNACPALRPAACAARCERWRRSRRPTRSPARWRACGAARSSRSRDSADSTSRATRATRARSRGCAHARRARRSRSP